MKNSIITYLKKASVDAIMNEDVDSAEKFMKYAELIKKHSNISLSTTTPLSRKKLNLFFISLK